MNREGTEYHFVGGLRRPARIGSVTYSWPLVGLYVFADRFEFGPAIPLMRRISRPLKVFKPADLQSAGPTKRGVRLTFGNGEQWIFGWCDVRLVLRVLKERGVPITDEVIPARWALESRKRLMHFYASDDEPKGVCQRCLGPIAAHSVQCRNARASHERGGS